MVQAMFFSPHFQCYRRWVLAEIHLIRTRIERKNMDPTHNCAIIWTILSMMKSARCMILLFFGSANTYTIHFIISGRFQKFPTHASNIPSNRAPPRTRVIGIFTLPGNRFLQKHMTLFAVTLNIIASIVYFFIYQPICFENTMLEEELVTYKLGIM